MNTDQMKQFHAAMKAMYAVIKEMNEHCVSEATQDLDYQMSVLNDFMSPAAITFEMVRDLRILTGEGMMACSNALKSARGDKSRAVRILRGQESL